MANIGSIFEISNLLRLNRPEKLSTTFNSGLFRKVNILGGFNAR